MEKKKIKTKKDIEKENYIKAYTKGYDKANEENTCAGCFIIAMVLGVVLCLVFQYAFEPKLPEVNENDVCNYLGYKYYQDNYRVDSDYCYNTPESMFQISDAYYGLIKEFLINERHANYCASQNLTTKECEKYD